MCGSDSKSIDIDLLLTDIKNAISLFAGKIVIRFPLNRDVLSNYFYHSDVFLTKARCVMPYFTAQINTKGDLIGLTRCYPVTFGNVLSDGFDEAWNSEKMCAFRRFIRKNERMPACSRCEGILYDL